MSIRITLQAMFVTLCDEQDEPEITHERGWKDGDIETEDPGVQDRHGLVGRSYRFADCGVGANRAAAPHCLVT
ncbi:MAG TPA: hypothetical protein VIM60_06890 [Edaphobacter sp.]